jgi:hypothetical protein
LAAKTDVKTLARAKADEVKATALRKKDELLAKAKQSTPAGGSSAAVGTTADSPAATTGTPNAAVEQLKGLAEENPVPTAALAAFIGGVADRPLRFRHAQRLIALSEAVSRWRPRRPL